MQRVEYPFNQLLPAGANDKNDRGIALLISGLSHLIRPPVPCKPATSVAGTCLKGPRFMFQGSGSLGLPFGEGLRQLGPDGEWGGLEGVE